MNSSYPAGFFEIFVSFPPWIDHIYNVVKTLSSCHQWYVIWKYVRQVVSSRWERENGAFSDWYIWNSIHSTVWERQPVMHFVSNGFVLHVQVQTSLRSPPSMVTQIWLILNQRESPNSLKVNILFMLKLWHYCWSAEDMLHFSIKPVVNLTNFQVSI